MAIVLKSKPGLSSTTTLNIPKDWDPTWFRNLISNQLKGADVRNAVGANGIVVSGTIASPYATISIGGTGPVSFPFPVTVNAPAGTVGLTINGATGQQAEVINGAETINGPSGGTALTITGTGAVDSPPLVSITKTSNYTGGTAGFVTPALDVTINVNSAGDTDDEWVILGILNNSSTGIGENVAGYFQGNKIVGNASPTWAAVIEVRELVATNNPTTGTVALELDIRCNGTDTGTGSRVGCDLVIAPYTPYPSGATASANWGYRIQNNNDGRSNVGFGFALAPGMIANIGFDTSHATINSGAYQLALGQAIIFDGPTTQANQLTYDGTGLLYKVSGVSQARLNADGSVQFGSTGLPVKLIGTTAATASAGTDGAPPAQVAGYLVGVISGTTVKIPYYLN